MLRYYTFVDYHSLEPSFRKEVVYNDMPMYRIPIMAPMRMPFRTEKEVDELIYMSPAYIEYERRSVWEYGVPKTIVYFNRAIPDPCVEFIIRKYFSKD